MGIEPTTLCLEGRCSTTELRPLKSIIATVVITYWLPVSIRKLKELTEKY